MDSSRRDSNSSDGPLVPALAAVLGSSGSDSDDEGALRAALEDVGRVTSSSLGLGLATPATPVKGSAGTAGEGPLSAGPRRLLLSPLSLVGGGLGGAVPSTPTLTVRLGAPVEGCALKPFVRARLPLAVAPSTTAAVGLASSSSIPTPAASVTATGGSNNTANGPTLERHHSYGGGGFQAGSNSATGSGTSASAEAIAASVITESDPRLVFQWWALRPLSSIRGNRNFYSSSDVTDANNNGNNEGGGGVEGAGAIANGTSTAATAARQRPYAVSCAYSCCPGSVTINPSTEAALAAASSSSSKSEESVGSGTHTGPRRGSRPQSSSRGKKTAPGSIWSPSAAGSSCLTSILPGSLEGWGWDGVNAGTGTAGLLRLLQSWKDSEDARVKAATAGASAATVTPVMTVGTIGSKSAATASASIANAATSNTSPAAADGGDKTGFHFNCAICDGLPSPTAAATAYGSADPSPAASPSASSSHSASQQLPPPSIPFRFCSLGCLLAGWREHAQYHNSSNSSSGSNSNSGVDGSSGSADVGPAPPGHAWVPVSSAVSYTPCPADVGRPLKLTVTLPGATSGAAAGAQASGSSGVDVTEGGPISRALDFSGGNAPSDAASHTRSGSDGSATSSGSGSTILPASSPTSSASSSQQQQQQLLTQVVFTPPVRAFPPGPPPRLRVALPHVDSGLAQVAEAAAKAASAAAAAASGPSPSATNSAMSGPPGLRPPPGLGRPPGLGAPAAAPSAAPTPSPSAASSTAQLPAQLRVMCWNVLADVYATGE